MDYKLTVSRYHKAFYHVFHRFCTCDCHGNAIIAGPCLLAEAYYISCKKNPPWKPDPFEPVTIYTDSRSVAYYLAGIIHAFERKTGTSAEVTDHEYIKEGDLSGKRRYYDVLEITKLRLYYYRSPGEDINPESRETRRRPRKQTQGPAIHIIVISPSHGDVNMSFEDAVLMSFNLSILRLAINDDSDTAHKLITYQPIIENHIPNYRMHYDINGGSPSHTLLEFPRIVQQYSRKGFKLCHVFLPTANWDIKNNYMFIHPHHPVPDPIPKRCLYCLPRCHNPEHFSPAP